MKKILLFTFIITVLATSCKKKQLQGECLDRACCYDQTANVTIINNSARVYEIDLGDGSNLLTSYPGDRLVDIFVAAGSNKWEAVSMDGKSKFTVRRELKSCGFYGWHLQE